MGAYAAGVGGAMQIAGSFLGAKAAKTRQKRLQSLADTPGIDPGAVTGEALAGSGSNFGLANALTNRVNTATAAGRRDLLETAIPGYEARKGTEANIIDSYLRGEIPQDVQDQLFNSAAGQALSRGVGGSQFDFAGRALRNVYTSLQLQGMGFDRANQFNSQTANLEMPDMVNVARYLGVTPTELTGIRSNERTQQLALKRAAIDAPGSKDVWAKTLTDVGGELAGGGLSTAGTSGFTSFSGLSGGGSKPAPIYMSGYGG